MSLTDSSRSPLHSSPSCSDDGLSHCREGEREREQLENARQDNTRSSTTASAEEENKPYNEDDDVCNAKSSSSDKESSEITSQETYKSSNSSDKTTSTTSDANATSEEDRSLSKILSVQSSEFMLRFVNEQQEFVSDTVSI